MRRALVGEIFALVVMVAASRAVPAQPTCSTGTLGSALRTTRAWAPPLDRPIALGGHELSLRSALDFISAQARFRLSYVTDYLPLGRRVCGGLSGEAGAVLARLLDGAGLDPVVVGPDHVALALVSRGSGGRVAAAATMASSTRSLERIVVTGSAAGASERRLTVGVDVVDGRTLRAHHVATLGDALASVPGVWVWEQSPADAISRFASIRGASSFGLSQPKIYVDGVQLANPLLLTQISAASIERIEVIRGPQGAALYGSDAISGVINVVSRHDGAPADGRRVSWSSSVGHAASAFASGVATQRHVLSTSLGPSTRSFGGSVEITTLGAFVPAAESRGMAARGTTRFVGGRSTLLLSAHFDARRAGPAINPLLDSMFAVTPGGTFAPSAAVEEDQRTRRYTVAATGTVLGNDRWTHTATLGMDGYALTNAALDAGPLPSAADSALRAANGGADRLTARGSSVARLWNTEGASASLTLGGEHSSLRERTLVRSNPQGFGFSPRTDETTALRHSTGILAQAEVAIRDALFVTGGLRFERASGYSLTSEYLALPMLGAAWTRQRPGASVKVHAAYGRGIRPPHVSQGGAPFVTMNRGAVSEPLRSETQRGVEFGADLALADRVTLRATRFDQHAAGLLQSVAVASDTQPRPGRPGGGPSRRIAYQLQNVGEIANRGWELQAAYGRGAVSVTGVLSLVDARVARVDVAYTGDLEAGDRPLEVPARVASVSATWRPAAWTLSATVARASDWVNYDRLALSEAFVSAERPSRDFVGAGLRQFWTEYSGVTRAHASVGREVMGRFTVSLSGRNLLNRQRGEPDNVTLVPGRMLSLGVGARF